MDCRRGGRRADRSAAQAEAAAAHAAEIGPTQQAVVTQQAALTAMIEQLAGRADAAEAGGRRRRRRRRLPAGRVAALEAQLADANARVADEQAARLRVEADNGTRRAAAEALGERVALLQEQVASPSSTARRRATRRSPSAPSSTRR